MYGNFNIIYTSTQRVPDKVYGSVLDQLQVVFDQAAFRPWYVNTVDPDPDRTAEEDCQ